MTLIFSVTTLLIRVLWSSLSFSIWVLRVWIDYLVDLGGFGVEVVGDRFLF
jgi:hypothetical protein